MVKPMRKRHDKMVVFMAAIAAIMLISVLGFNTTQELTSVGTGFAIFSGFALITPAILAIVLFTFLVFKIRE